MILVRTVEPAAEPVSTAEAKDHVRVDISDDDALIGALIATAREYVEEASRRALVTQTWRFSLEAWPETDTIELPRAPLQSVTTFSYTDEDGNSTTLVEGTDYEVDAESEPGKVVLAANQSWPWVDLHPKTPIQITYVAGYGDASDVPQRWKQAVLLLVGHWYENRELAVVSGAVPKEIPFAVESLINLDRVW